MDIQLVKSRVSILALIPIPVRPIQPGCDNLGTRRSCSIRCPGHLPGSSIEKGMLASCSKPAKDCPYGCTASSLNSPLVCCKNKTRRFLVVLTS